MKILRSSWLVNAICLCIVFPKGMNPNSLRVNLSGISGLNER